MIDEKDKIAKKFVNLSLILFWQKSNFTEKLTYTFKINNAKRFHVIFHQKHQNTSENDFTKFFTEPSFIQKQKEGDMISRKIEFCVFNINFHSVVSTTQLN